MDPNTSLTTTLETITGGDLNGDIVETWPLGAKITDYTTGELAIIQFYMGILTILGFTCNGIVLYLYFSTKSLQTPMNMLFISLTFGDMLVTCAASFVSFIHTVMVWEMSEQICAIYGFCAYLGGKIDFLIIYSYMSTCICRMSL